jgi:HlyD family secretion protein
MKVIEQIKNIKIDKNWFSRHIKQIIIAVVVLTAFTGVAISSMAIAENEAAVRGTQGIIEAKDVSVNSKIPGRISEIYVSEGQKVNVGDPLVAIASEELEAKKLQLLAQITQAEAGVEASQAVIEMAEANYKIAQERISQAQAGVQASESQRDMAGAVDDKAQNGARTQQVAQAESAYLLMQNTYERASILYDGGAISLQKIEEIRTQRDIYQQTLNMAKEGARTEDKAAASAQLSMAQAGVVASNAVLNQAIEASNIATAQVNQANAGLQASQGKLDQAKAGLQEVEVYLKDSVITAPIEGTVTTINSDEGELVSTGSSIGTISNLETCWVNVNLDEDKLSGVIEGQSVDIHLIAYPEETYKGIVVTINSQPDFAIKKATNENGNFDIVSFGVKIELDNQEEVLRPGMTAIADFNGVDVN